MGLWIDLQPIVMKQARDASQILRSYGYDNDDLVSESYLVFDKFVKNYSHLNSEREIRKIFKTCCKNHFTDLFRKLKKHNTPSFIEDDEDSPIESRITGEQSFCFNPEWRILLSEVPEEFNILAKHMLERKDNNSLWSVSKIQMKELGIRVDSVKMVRKHLTNQ